MYLKPQILDGIFQYLTVCADLIYLLFTLFVNLVLQSLDLIQPYFPMQTVFATDLHSRGFMQLPKSVGVDFRASYVKIIPHHLSSLC